MSFAQLKQRWDYFFTWTILHTFDFHCFEFDTWQVEILEVECIMADFFEAGITNMVREGETCLILPYFMIQQHLFFLKPNHLQLQERSWRSTLVKTKRRWSLLWTRTIDPQCHFWWNELVLTTTHDSIYYLSIFNQSTFFSSINGFCPGINWQSFLYLFNLNF